MFENLRAKEAISFLAIYAALQESPINILRKSFDQEGSSLTNSFKNWSLNQHAFNLFKKIKIKSTNYKLNIENNPVSTTHYK